MASIEKVQELKDKGNECVKAGNYAEAILHYTHAIKLDPTQYQLYSNRSLAFLKMQQYFHALEDAKETIRLKPDWAKGYYRKAEVEFNAEQYEEALKSYSFAFQCHPDDACLREAIKQSKMKIDHLKKTELRIPWLGASIGLVLGLIITIGDYLVAEQPILQHPLLKVLMILTIAGIGYFFARLYRYYLRLQRNSMLDPPIDLLGGKCDNSNNVKNNSKSDDKHRFSKAAARQRYKKGKS